MVNKSASNFIVILRTSQELAMTVKAKSLPSEGRGLSGAPSNFNELANAIGPTCARRARRGRLNGSPRCGPNLHRLIFIDETGTNTKMTRARGRCESGERLRFKAPFGHWKTQTFVAGLRCGALTAPWVIDAPMDRTIFETCTQLVPTLQEGDYRHPGQSARPQKPGRRTSHPQAGRLALVSAAQQLDLNPIEMAFAKLKALLRARPIRTIDALWRAIAEICDLFHSARMPKLLRRRRLRIHMKVRCSSAVAIDCSSRSGELRAALLSATAAKVLAK